MNERQIDRLVRRHVRDFNGVYSSDSLPSKPNLFVANTRPSDHPGEHWIAVAVKDGRGFYFDSFGLPPPKSFEKYMNRHCSEWTYNDRQFQSSISSFCGHYCVCFCILKSRNLDLCSILSSDTGLNDVTIHELVCRFL